MEKGRDSGKTESDKGNIEESSCLGGHRSLKNWTEPGPTHWETLRSTQEHQTKWGSLRIGINLTQQIEEH